MLGQKKKTPSNIVSKKEKVLKKSRKNKLDQVHGGEIHAINDARTRGHGSIICKPTKKERKENVVKHVPLTHSDKTRNMKNIPLRENPQKGAKEQSYILPKVQKTRGEKLGARKKDTVVKNATDKSVLRHIKKEDKKRR